MNERIASIKRSRNWSWATVDSAYALARMGHGYAVEGRKAEARAVLKQLNELATHRYVSPYDVAIAHLGLGDKDQAFVWLEKAFQQRSVGMGYLGVEPMFDPLRSDGRFQNLLRRVGLCEQ